MKQLLGRKNVLTQIAHPGLPGSNIGRDFYGPATYLDIYLDIVPKPKNLIFQAQNIMIIAFQILPCIGCIPSYNFAFMHLCGN